MSDELNNSPVVRNDLFGRLDIYASFDDIDEGNIVQELNSALIADAMNLSQRQLNRKVNSVLGIDTASYIRQMRIHKAQELLLETEDPVGDIGYNCGFESSSYFSKIFRQHTGLTPSEYRKKHSPQ